jgi:hypothetical protein
MLLIDKLNSKTQDSLCRYFGHKWLYNDYTNWMKENGDHYDFRASRKCARCHKHEYLYEDWREEVKNIRYDIQSDFEATRQFQNQNMHLMR